MPTQEYTPRERYLCGLKRIKLAVLAVQTVSIAAFLGLWELLTAFEIMDAFIFSSPSKIVKTFVQLAQSGLGYHIMVTVFETAVGFFL
ncbi:MAG: ABC transporter permease, partial [Oscillospiraceae bacterium]